MAQPEISKLKGKWKGLFICPNANIIRDLLPLLSRHLPNFAGHELTIFPTRHQIAEIFATQGPNLCFLEVSEPQERSFAVIPELLRVDPKLPIIVVLPSNDPELVLRCLRQGATDFLIAPFTGEHLEAALQKISRLQPGRVKSPGKVYCIMPAKGGCGASTIASNLAYQLKRLGDKRILLADLDPLAGTLSFLLKIKSNYSFMDALARSGELDADLWKTVVTSRQGVDILLSPEVMTEGVGDLSDTSAIVEYARGIYDLVVLDAGSVYGDWNLSQATLADEILPRLDALQKRVEEIARTPLPPQTIARGFAGIAKREDAGAAITATEDVVAALARMSDEERTLTLIKASHANPMAPVGAPFGRPAGFASR